MILKTHYNFSEDDLKQLKDVLENVPYTEIMNKIYDLHEKITLSLPLKIILSPIFI